MDGSYDFLIYKIKNHVYSLQNHKFNKWTYLYRSS